ncbi:MAG: RrF2 family transcriptional regulator [Marinibacterium sp.]
MRLTIRTNLAARVLMSCAVNAGRVVRTSEVSELCNASRNHLARVVQKLHVEGFIETSRGRSGGIWLARPPAEISIGQVFRLFENEIPFAECYDARNNSCPLTQSCRLRNHVSRALNAFYAELDKVTLQELVEDNCGLQTILSVHDSLQTPAPCSTPQAAAGHG